MNKIVKRTIWQLAVVWLLSLFDGGASMMAAVAEGVEGVGKHVTGEPHDTDVERAEAPGLIHDPIDQEIVKMFQSAIPIEQITRMSQSQTVKGMRYKYYSADTRPFVAVTQAAVAGGSVSATLTLSPANIFDWTDVLYLPDVAGYNSKTGAYDSTTPLRLYIVKGGSEGFVVQAINGEPTNDGTESMNIPAIPAGTKVIRLGHAASEGDVQTPPYTALPSKEENYMQIFKSQVLESTISMESEREVNWTPTDTDELNIHNMRKEIELTYLFGAKGYIRNENTRRYVYTCEGIYSQIMRNGQVIGYDPNNFDENDLVDMSKNIFTGNNGSSDRLMLAGSEFIATLAKLPSIQRNIDATSVERVFGYTWNKIVTNFGTLHMLMHPLFDEVGISDQAIVIDKQYLQKKVFRPMSRLALDLIASGVYDGKSTVLTEISSICLKYGKCHAIIKPV